MLEHLPFRSRNSKGFTLIELLTVVGIIGLLIAMALPGIQQARESARRMQCSNHLKQLALALHQYESVFEVFPPGSQVANFRTPPEYSKGFGWTVAILPYIEQQSIYSQIDFDLDCQIHHRALTSQPVSTFLCPSDPKAGHSTEWTPPTGRHPVWGEYFKGGWGVTNYIGVSGIGGGLPAFTLSSCDDWGRVEAHQKLQSGIFFGNSSIRLSDITDGTSSTFMLVERGVFDAFNKWGGAGLTLRCPFGLFDVTMPSVISKSVGGLQQRKSTESDLYHIWSHHPGGSNYALADGSVKFYSYETDRRIQENLSTRSGAEIVTF